MRILSCLECWLLGERQKCRSKLNGTKCVSPCLTTRLQPAERTIAAMPVLLMAHSQRCRTLPQPATQNHHTVSSNRTN